MKDTAYYRNEVWLPIDQTNDRYEISSMGRIRRLYHRGGFGDKKLTKPRLMSPGVVGKYLHITLFGEKHVKQQYYLHRLVLCAFDPIEGMDDMCVNHLDFNTHNNKLNNLSWVTHKENTQYSIERGRFDAAFKLREQRMSEKWVNGTHPFLRPDVQANQDKGRRNRIKKSAKT